MVFTQDWPVTTEGSDASGRLSLPYLCSLLQETATYHADALGWGYADLEAQGLQWVLSRQWIRMDRSPRWKDRIRIATWPSGKGAITWNRDFRILDADGEILGVATSFWLTMDRKTRRPRPAGFGSDMDFTAVDTVKDGDLKPLPALAHPRKTRSVRAAYHDIDVHDHINNVRYLTWMIDALDPEFLRAHRAKETEINFLAEGFAGDALDVFDDAAADDPAQRLQSLRRDSGESELCRMRTAWVPDESPNRL